MNTPFDNGPAPDRGRDTDAPHIRDSARPEASHRESDTRSELDWRPATSSASSAGSALESRLQTGDLYARAGDHAQALETFLSVWPLCAGHDMLYVAWRIGDCQAKLGRLSEAIALLRPIVDTHDPELLEDQDKFQYGKCLQQLGICYFGAGRLDEAQSAGFQAVECFAGTGTAELGNAHSLLGGVALHSGDVDLAGTHFRKALEQYRALGDVSMMATAYSNLGSVYKRTCEWERALEYYNASYFLQATEGEFQTQGAVHQNLGIVLSNVGRLQEAREHLEKSLRRATELAQPLRALRARLAAVRLCRMRFEFGRARSIIRDCSAEHPGSVPERETCLLLLEEGWLDLLEGRLDGLADRLSELHARVGKMAARGDLMLETLQLRAAMAIHTGLWSEAEGTLEEALFLAREDRDRHQEAHFLANRARVLGALGHVNEARQTFDEVTRRFERSGERPALASVLEWRGDFASATESDPAAAVALYRRARDLARSMHNERLELLLDLKLAGARLLSGELRDVRLRSLDDRLAILPDVDPGFRALAERVAAPLKERTDTEPHPTDGAKVLRNLEEVFAWEAEPNEKLRASLSVLAEAVGAQGALLARINGTELEVVSTLSMGWLEGKRKLELDGVGYDVPGHPCLVDRVQDVSELPYESAIAIPTVIGAQRYLLHLERREGERFSPAESGYAGLLLAEVARAMTRIEAAPTDEATTGPLAKLRHGIYVADIITQDSRMLSILSLVNKIANSDLTVLLQGETGTGKRLVAHAIHRSSERRDAPFVTVDCAALPDSLLESELFGHCKGAFTGATQDRTGLFEEADGGTIFLDEIDKAGPAVQRRFLHLLDTGEVRPVGATGYRRLDVRVVCATSIPDLSEEVAAGRFIKDLYYRLNDIAIQIPALRERTDDIGLLAECFLERFCLETGRDVRGVAPDFFEALAAHSWPGNVRELEKAIRRAVTLADDGEVLTARTLPKEILASSGSAARGGNLKDRLEDVERDLLREALERNRWNKSRAAAELGLSRKGLKGKIERFALDRRNGRRRP